MKIFKKNSKFLFSEFFIIFLIINENKYVLYFIHILPIHLFLIGNVGHYFILVCCYTNLVYKVCGGSFQQTIFLKSLRSLSSHYVQFRRLANILAQYVFYY
jgi:hypothetical protein